VRDAALVRASQYANVLVVFRWSEEEEVADDRLYTVALVHAHASPTAVAADVPVSRVRNMARFRAREG